MSRVALPVDHLSSSLVAELCLASLRHILFIREIVPFSVDDIMRTTAGGESSSERVSAHRPSARKIDNFCGYFGCVEEELRVLCSAVDVAEVQIVFGPTLTSPREIYCLHFPELVDREAEMVSEKKCRECVRKILRNYVQHWAEVSGLLPSPTNVFIAVKPRNSPLSNVGGVLSCFGSRQYSCSGFTTKLRKKAPLPHHLWCSSRVSGSTSNLPLRQKSDSIDSDELKSTAFGNNGDGKIANSSQESENLPWFVLKKGIKALKNIKMVV